MSSEGDFEVIRDPLWNNIRLNGDTLRLLDSKQFQRLRYVRQLGHAYLVYPGATHSRFEHALGTYHLARRVISLLGERGELANVGESDRRLITAAALLHDIGHYPFSHALEEAGLHSHEELARNWLSREELGTAVDAIGADRAGERIYQLIRGTSSLPLQGLISGSLDLDKIDYLTRDAKMCGVPYGTVDVDRLVHSITLVEVAGHRVVGIHEKGVSALESLLFAKYQMYRNVYWHHGVRSATAMFKRLVATAIRTGQIDTETVARATDESLMETLAAGGDSLLLRLRHRKLFKRALDLPATGLAPGFGDWMSARPDQCSTVEDELAEELGLEAGDLLLDLPSKPAMLAADLPVLKRDGSVVHLGSPEGDELMGISSVADQLHTNARRFRVFVAEPRQIDADWIVDRLADAGNAPPAGRT